MSAPSIRVQNPILPLTDLIRRMNQVAKDDFKRDLNQQLGATAIHLVGAEFEEGRDPYGKPWRPSGRDGQTLRDTGRLLNSFTPYGRTLAGSFGIGTAAKYAPVHQYGATIKPKNGPVLTFKVQTGIRRTNRRTGAALKRAVVLSRWVSVKQVVIPQRQMVPEGDIGPIWMRAFEADVDAAIVAAMGTHG